MAQATGVMNANTKVVPNSYEIDWINALVAGVAATLLFSACYFPVFFMYRQDSLDLTRVLGSVLFQEEWLARGIGFLLHMGVGVGIALTYAVILWVFNWQSNGGKGTVFGFLVFVPMFAFFLPWFIGWLPKFAPWTGVHLPPVDVLMNQAGHGNLGWEAPAFVLCAHLMYGLLLGAAYRHKPRSGSYLVEYGGG